MMAPDTDMHEYNIFLGMPNALVTSKAKLVSRVE